MAKSVSKIVLYFLAAGAVVPCLLQTIFYLEILPIERVPEWLFFALWPAFGFYMGSDTGTGSDGGKAAFGFLLSVIANSFVYGLLGGVVSFFYRYVYLVWQARSNDRQSGK